MADRVIPFSGDDAAVVLRAMWCDLRNDCSPVAKARVNGAISLACLTGLFNFEQQELWLRRIETCPGHHGDGGRSWCAYCDDLKPDTDE